MGTGRRMGLICIAFKRVALAGSRAEPLLSLVDWQQQQHHHPMGLRGMRAWGGGGFINIKGGSSIVITTQFNVSQSWLFQPLVASSLRNDLPGLHRPIRQSRMQLLSWRLRVLKRVHMLPKCARVRLCQMRERTWRLL